MIQSAYNFVPLNKYVYIPDWWNQVSNDVPFCDGEDGSIEFLFTNISPLFTRNGSKSKNEEYSAHIPADNGERLYFLPGSSIKGMLRSTLETLSFGKMAQFNDRSFGYRTFNEKENDYESYHSIIKDQKCGWLQKVGDDYNLIPCDGDFETIGISEVKRMYSSLSGKDGIGARNIAIGLYPEYSYHGQLYRIVCTGKMENRKEPEKSKKHEYLFPVATLSPISLMEKVGEKVEKKKVLKQFLSVYAQNKDATTFFENYLEKGKRVHVFYVLNSQGDIAVMGLSKMMKLPYNNSIQDLVKKRQKTVEGRDLCETIFGYTTDSDNDTSLKGRVMTTNAFCVDANGKNCLIADDQLIRSSGVLGEPKPSFYPFYVEQDRAAEEYNTYENADTIAGRKVYRIHRNSTPTPLPKGNNNEKVLTSFRAIPAGYSFKCKICLHNMRPIEIGAILYALTLENGSYHNIGMAKAYGYGKLKCHDIRTSLKKTVEEYIEIFKEEISRWGRDVVGKAEWDYDRRIEVATLMAILKEHTDDEVRMPEMKYNTGEMKSDGKPETVNQFTLIKRNFQTLTEETDISTMQSEVEEERQARLAKEQEETEKRQEEAWKLREEAKKLRDQEELSNSLRAKVITFRGALRYAELLEGKDKTSKKLVIPDENSQNGKEKIKILKKKGAGCIIRVKFSNDKKSLILISIEN